MNLNFSFSLNKFLYMIRTTFLFGYKYHCNICGYPTDDINKLHLHGLCSHPDIMNRHLIEYEYDNCV